MDIARKRNGGYLGRGAAIGILNEIKVERAEENLNPTRNPTIRIPIRIPVLSTRPVKIHLLAVQ